MLCIVYLVSGTDHILKIAFVCVCVRECERERETEKQRDRETEKREPNMRKEEEHEAGAVQYTHLTQREAERQSWTTLFSRRGCF